MKKNIIITSSFVIAVLISSSTMGSVESKDRHAAHITGKATHEVQHMDHLHYSRPQVAIQRVVRAVPRSSSIPIRSVRTLPPHSSSGSSRVHQLVTLADLPLPVQRTFACIRWVESRGHTVDGNSQTGEGLYQFMPEIWQYAARALNYKGVYRGGVLVGGPAFSANQATAEQQNDVAAFFWSRNHGLKPEWYDGCAGE